MASWIVMCERLDHDGDEAEPVTVTDLGNEVLIELDDGTELVFDRAELVRLLAA